MRRCPRFFCPGRSFKRNGALQGLDLQGLDLQGLEMPGMARQVVPVILAAEALRGQSSWVRAMLSKPMQPNPRRPLVRSRCRLRPVCFSLAWEAFSRFSDAGDAAYIVDRGSSVLISVRLEPQPRAIRYDSVTQIWERFIS
jgi:hypothetical protein